LNKLRPKNNSSQFSFNVGNVTSPFVKESEPLANVLKEFTRKIESKESNKSSETETIRIIETLSKIESKLP